MFDKIKTIIVDDEPNARAVLRGIIESHFPDLEIVAEASDVPEAVRLIQKLKPQAVFLDIEMPVYSGIELLDFFDKNNIFFKIIFVTAYSEYALQAFELSAVDYLLKPVQIHQLERAVEKLRNFMQYPIEFETSKYEVLKNNYQNNLTDKKIALHIAEGIVIVKLDEILYLKADGSYTHLILIKGNKLTVSKKLIEYERLQEVGNFMRVHRSYIVNLNYVTKVLRKDGGVIVMENGEELLVSAEKKQTLIDKLNELKI